MTISYLIVPKKIQEIFLGKHLQTYELFGHDDEIKTKLSKSSDPNILIFLNEDSIKIGYKTKLFVNGFKTTFLASVEKNHLRTIIVGKFEYSLSAKISIIAFTCIPIILFSLESFIFFNIVIFYAIIQTVGLILLFLDLFNLDREQLIIAHLQQACMKK